METYNLASNRASCKFPDISLYGNKNGKQEGAQKGREGGKIGGLLPGEEETRDWRHSNLWVRGMTSRLHSKKKSFSAFLFPSQSLYSSFLFLLQYSYAYLLLRTILATELNGFHFFPDGNRNIQRLGGMNNLIVLNSNKGWDTNN
ncbi:hypothetical protein Dimus_000684 [Dionaea muscipula]